MLLLTKQFSLPSAKNILLCKINNNKVIVLQKVSSEDNQYIIIPNFINSEKQENILNFSCAASFNTLFNVFINAFALRLKCFEKNTRKKIILTGLGYKVNFSDDKQSLVFKIGLSHVVALPIPLSEIQVFIIKNTLVVEGLNPVCVGNFAKKIKSLKYPDAYKGKGFWYRNEIKTLKPVKKT